MSFLKAFPYAFRGILYCIKNERNMRFHTVAALYVLIFARFFAFSKTDYLILLLTIGVVMALEAVNTAVERVCNKVCRKRDPVIGHAKDAAAGAVLLAAIAAAVIGVLLFSDSEGWVRAWEFYTTRWANGCALIGSAVIALLYIVFGPVIPFRRKKRSSEVPSGRKDEQHESE